MTDQIFYTEAAGNTFFLSFSDKLSFDQISEFSISIGKTPDGYVLLRPLEDSVFKFDFFNNDGSNVDFCGNALRSVGLCYESQFGKKALNLKTNAGNLFIETKGDGLVEAQMPAPILKGNIRVFDHLVPYIMSGVPHLVFDQKEFSIAAEDLRDFCTKVRSLNLEGAEKFNLTFFEPGTQPVKCVTFERGVEDFTQACGSGALSVAHVVGGDEVDLKMPGGQLKVEKNKGKFYMTGPALINEVFEFKPARNL